MEHKAVTEPYTSCVREAMLASSHDDFSKKNDGGGCGDGGDGGEPSQTAHIPSIIPHRTSTPDAFPQTLG